MSTKRPQQRWKHHLLAIGITTACGAWHAAETRAAADGPPDVPPPAEVPGVSPTPAAASAEPSAEYYRAVELALAEHERRHFEEARALFQRAHEIFPNARTLRGLGKVEFELRNYGEAVKLLKAALSSEVRPLDATLRAETQNILDVAEEYVGEVRVRVEPDTATVSVDGVTVAAGPSASFSLLVGDHVLEFRALGRVPERRSVRVRAGEPVSVHVVLASPFGESEAKPAPAVTATLAPAPQAERKDAPLTRTQKIWIGVGAGLAVVIGLAVGLGVGLSRRTRTADPVASTNTPPGLAITVGGE